MNAPLLNTLGRLLVILALALLFVAYSNFVPTALSSEMVADYVKNHFVREIVFGVFLAGWGIRLALRPSESIPLAKLSIAGSVVVLPFWIALVAGWSVGGMSEVWGDEIGPEAAFVLHGSQVLMFYLGLLLLCVGRRYPGD
jgi:peptidoglycan/LPS O-acetylase OafA/YrhL